MHMGGCLAFKNRFNNNVSNNNNLKKYIVFCINHHFIRFVLNFIKDTLPKKKEVAICVQMIQSKGLILS